MTGQSRGLLPALGAAVVLLFMASLLIGQAKVPPMDALRALLGRGDPLLVIVMQEIRLPRALLAVLLGASLGLSGAAMQGFLRNPLAEPGLIGTSASAALGAVLALQTGLAVVAPAFFMAAPLAGALLSFVLILMLAGSRGGAMPLILAGIAISALAGAMTSLVLNLSPNPFAANEIVFWMMGSLADRSMAHVWMVLPFFCLGTGLILATGRGLEALTLGEEAATTMGISLPRLRLMLLAGVVALIGSVTAVAGAVGFVGLIVPHLLRRAVGSSPARLLPASALGGAAVILAADIAARTIAPGRDLKLGVLTALVGAPFFFHLIWRLRRETT
ncbi:ABC transporter permease [Haematobacter massiliensis]|uniref:ABC transporter permease n=2 Tax=Haematobacter massiliensis TaxID=195105 RepID=A0A086Y810_9RHOB|nr:iron ABC transporter permease [Haematobacter massiliensis]KFI30410.1 ABC transporter permease [Haematobacter massiliensis]